MYSIHNKSNKNQKQNKDDIKLINKYVLSINNLYLIDNKKNKYLYDSLFLFRISKTYQNYFNNDLKMYYLNHYYYCDNNIIDTYNLYYNKKTIKWFIKNININSLNYIKTPLYSNINLFIEILDLSYNLKIQFLSNKMLSIFKNKYKYFEYKLNNKIHYSWSHPVVIFKSKNKVNNFMKILKILKLNNVNIESIIKFYLINQNEKYIIKKKIIIDRFIHLMGKKKMCDLMVKIFL